MDDRSGDTEGRVDVIKTYGEIRGRTQGVRREREDNESEDVARP